MAGRGILLPGGRGPLAGADAPSVRGEDYRKRSNELSNDVGWVYSTTGMSSFQGVNAPTAGTLYIAQANEALRDVQATQIRARLQAGVAGQVCRMGLYTVELVPQPCFKLIPGSEISLDSNSTSVQTFKTSRPIIIPQKVPLFVAFVSSNAGVIPYAAYKPTSLKAFRVGSHGTDDLPSSINIASTADVGQVDYWVADMTFLSKNAERIF